MTPLIPSTKNKTGSNLSIQEYKKTKIKGLKTN